MWLCSLNIIKGKLVFFPPTKELHLYILIRRYAQQGAGAYHWLLLQATQTANLKERTTAQKGGSEFQMQRENTSIQTISVAIKLEIKGFFLYIFFLLFFIVQYNTNITTWLTPAEMPGTSIVSKNQLYTYAKLKIGSRSSTNPILAAVCKSHVGSLLHMKEERKYKGQKAQETFSSEQQRVEHRDYLHGKKYPDY